MKNEIFCIPVNNKTNLIERVYIESTLFEYKKSTFFGNHKLAILLLIIETIIIIYLLDNYYWLFQV